jgi:two-component system, NarL family, response regulator LiaR
MITVGIIEGNLLYAEALTSALHQSGNIDVVFIQTHFRNFDNIIENSPDVLILDTHKCTESGPGCVRKIKQLSPSTNILLFALFDEEEIVMELLRSGANGIVQKNVSFEKVLEAIEALNKGETILSGRISKKILNSFQNKIADSNQYQLSKREKEILQGLMNGLSYKEIATSCFVSIDTVNSHVRNIYSKLNVHSRAEISAKFR